MQGLTTNEASLIYRSQYFTKPGLDAVRDPEIQEFLFDYGVNSGPVAAVRALQTALGVKADGEFGPEFKAALGKINESAGAVLSPEMRALRDAVALHRQQPGQRRLRHGWANCLDQFEDWSRKIAQVRCTSRRPLGDLRWCWPSLAGVVVVQVVVWMGGWPFGLLLVEPRFCIRR